MGMNYLNWKNGKKGEKSAIAQDESLAEHDKKYHPDGFDPKKDECKLRETMAAEGKKDDLGGGEKGEDKEERDLVDAFEKDSTKTEGPYMTEAYKALPWKQKVEVAKKFRDADVAAQKEGDFLADHQSLDKNNREVFDSKESESEAKRLSEEYDRINKEANDTFKMYAEANGWGLGENEFGDTAWVEKSEGFKVGDKVKQKNLISGSESTIIAVGRGFNGETIYKLSGQIYPYEWYKEHEIVAADSADAKEGKKTEAGEEKKTEEGKAAEFDYDGFFDRIADAVDVSEIPEKEWARFKDDIRETEGEPDFDERVAEAKELANKYAKHDDTSSGTYVPGGSYGTWKYLRHKRR